MHRNDQLEKNNFQGERNYCEYSRRRSFAVGMKLPYLYEAFDFKLLSVNNFNRSSFNPISVDVQNNGRNPFLIKNKRGRIQKGVLQGL